MSLSNEAQMKILNSCKGKTIAKAEHMLVVAEGFVRQKQCELRVRLTGIVIGS